jgi:hypothetical protein
VKGRELVLKLDSKARSIVQSLERSQCPEMAQVRNSTRPANSGDQRLRKTVTRGGHNAACQNRLEITSFLRQSLKRAKVVMFELGAIMKFRWASAAFAVATFFGTQAFAAETAEKVNGIEVVPFTYILERLKCDVWAASKLAAADGYAFTKGKGSFTLKAEISDTITGGIGVEIEATAAGASLGGSLSKSKGNVRQIDIPFTIDVTDAPKFDCDRLMVKTKDGTLKDERLFEYVSLNKLASKVGQGGAIIKLSPASYGGEFSVTRTGAGTGELTILVFTAKGGIEQERGLTQEFTLELDFGSAPGKRVFPTK